MSLIESSRCVLLFARAARVEAADKGLAHASSLFQETRRRLAAEVSRLAGVDLVVAGPEGLEQRGDSFGQRLLNAFEDARSMGYREVVAVPADAPALGAVHLRAAFEALRSRAVVLGASPDGGVYLIGATRSVADLFRGVRWRTAMACADLMANAPAAAVLADRVADVDGRADLIALRDDPEMPADLRLLIRSLLARAPAPARADVQAPASLIAADRAAPRSPPRRSVATR